ncbi:MAG TPA: hypothetical protein VE396_12450 [Xanthobacteraceae bacterium]|nr:hypothetical protein [Xanthobacteraceae bacterium]
MASAGDPGPRTLTGKWTRGLLIRRNIADGDLAFFSTWCPQRRIQPAHIIALSLRRRAHQAEARRAHLEEGGDGGYIHARGVIEQRRLVEQADLVAFERRYLVEDILGGVVFGCDDDFPEALSVRLETC